MGSAVRARCDCGYGDLFLIGSGFVVPEHCWFPCLCRDCKAIVLIDVLEVPLACRTCGGRNVMGYTHEQLCGEQGDKQVACINLSEYSFGRPLTLSNGRYYCPSCDSMNLRFSDGGIKWD